MIKTKKNPNPIEKIFLFVISFSISLLAIIVMRTLMGIEINLAIGIIVSIIVAGIIIKLKMVLPLKNKKRLAAG